jgi:hypothetical protein
VQDAERVHGVDVPGVGSLLIPTARRVEVRRVRLIRVPIPEVVHGVAIRVARPSEPTQHFSSLAGEEQPAESLLAVDAHISTTAEHAVKCLESEGWWVGFVAGAVEAAFVVDVGGAVLGPGAFSVGIASARYGLGGGLLGSTNVAVGVVSCGKNRAPLGVVVSVAVMPPAAMRRIAHSAKVKRSDIRHTDQ